MFSYLSIIMSIMNAVSDLLIKSIIYSSIIFIKRKLLLSLVQSVMLDLIKGFGRNTKLILCMLEQVKNFPMSKQYHHLSQSFLNWSLQATGVLEDGPRVSATQ